VWWAASRGIPSLEVWVEHYVRADWNLHPGSVTGTSPGSSSRIVDNLEPGIAGILIRGERILEQDPKSVAFLDVDPQLRPNFPSARLTVSGRRSSRREQKCDSHPSQNSIGWRQSPRPGWRRSTPGRCVRAAEAPDLAPKQLGHWQDKGGLTVAALWREINILYSPAYWPAILLSSGKIASRRE
jgi:hypothetical protein